MNTDPQMRAITRLLDEAQPALSIREIAEAIHTTTQTVSHYRHFKRFPTANSYRLLVDLALERGVLLYATDFLKPRAVA